MLVYPQPRFSHNSHSSLVEVNRENTISLPLVNVTKSDKMFKPGIILGSSEKVDLAPSPQVNVTQKIHNDLILQNDNVSHQGIQVKKLRKFIKNQNWQPYSLKANRLALTILKHDPFFSSLMRRN